MKFEVTGYDLDELIKKLQQKKVTITHIEKKDFKNIAFEVAEKDAHKVKRYVGNFIVKKTPSFFKRLPKFVLLNLGCVLGVFAGTLFGLFASNYVWKIEVFGTKNLTKQEVLSVLKENGISVGKLNIKTSKEIEDVLLLSYDRLAQVSAIKVGTAIIINLSEKLVYNPTQFEPIKAKFNGIIDSIELETGTLNCKVGDYVNIGEVLVLPFNLNANGEKISVEPKAEIFGKIYVVAQAVLPERQLELKRTGKSKVTYDYSLFGYHIFCGKTKNSFALFECLSYNENVGRLLPFKRTKTTYYELSQVEKINDLQQNKQSLAQESRLLAENQLGKEKEILSCTQTVNIVNSVMYATTTLEVIGKING